MTLNRLVDELRDLLGVDVEPVYAAPRPGDVRHSLADLSRARQELGYEPAVHLRDGLERTMEHACEEELAAEPAARCRCMNVELSPVLGAGVAGVALRGNPAGDQGR